MTPFLSHCCASKPGKAYQVEKIEGRILKSPPAASIDRLKKSIIELPVTTHCHLTPIYHLSIITLYKSKTVLVILPPPTIICTHDMFSYVYLESQTIMVQQSFRIFL